MDVQTNNPGRELDTAECYFETGEPVDVSEGRTGREGQNVLDKEPLVTEEEGVHGLDDGLNQWMS
jgi:hypothetical protein